MPVTTLVFETAMPCSQAKLWDFHSTSEAIHQLCPFFTKVQLAGNLNVTNGAQLRVRSTMLGFIHQTWEVELSDVNPPHGFTDRASTSPFLEWCHHHLFQAAGENSVLRDEVSFLAPGGQLGRLGAIIFITILFKFRHWRTKTLLKR